MILIVAHHILILIVIRLFLVKLEIQLTKRRFIIVRRLDFKKFYTTQVKNKKKEIQEKLEKNGLELRKSKKINFRVNRWK